MNVHDVDKFFASVHCLTFFITCVILRTIKICMTTTMVVICISVQYTECTVTVNKYDLGLGVYTYIFFWMGHLLNLKIIYVGCFWRLYTRYAWMMYKHYNNFSILKMKLCVL